jgi:hypothetical protein
MSKTFKTLAKLTVFGIVTAATAAGFLSLGWTIPAGLVVVLGVITAGFETADDEALDEADTQ